MGTVPSLMNKNEWISKRIFGREGNSVIYGSDSDSMQEFLLDSFSICNDTKERLNPQ
jgi:hypothetical protein